MVWFLGGPRLGPGWAQAGPRLGPSCTRKTIMINDLVQKYCPNSVLVIIDPNPNKIRLPTEVSKVGWRL